MTIYKNLIYKISAENHNKKELKKLLTEHPEIKFVSFVGIDLWGNDTDEKIPVNYFLEDIEDMLENGIQTDGSSVNLSEIATLSDARVDLIPDKEAVWYVDYNYENIDHQTNLPTGTLRIISFLLHNGRFIDSRYTLKKSLDIFRNRLLEKINNKDLLDSYEINVIEDIDSIELMLGTELEFWVRTPYDSVNIEKLVLSQTLKEQYWKRTKGIVRTALEQSLQLLELYGIHPEMGHKEVGGISTYIAEDRLTDNHIVEQLEIDWKYNKAIQSADNELLARIIIKEAFRLHGLEVSFLAKPIIGVAGNGEHCHLSIIATLKNGNKINLLAPTEENTYLSKIGWGMIMGILKNYSAINPFISNTSDALNRLKPGYEAPTHVVASIGDSPAGEIRNRTVLACLVKDKNNPLSTRFELRAPNPKTNTYLAVSAIIAGILDGITFVLQEELTNKELEQEFCKDFETEGKYFQKDKIYREEKDIFESYTEKERDKYFGKSPRTVYENISNLQSENIIGTVLDQEIINSHIDLSITNWILDLSQRIIPENRQFIRSCVKRNYNNDYDNETWEKIQALKEELAKDKKVEKSIITKIIESAHEKNFEQVSNLQIKMNSKMEELKQLYTGYINNEI